MCASVHLYTPKFTHFKDILKLPFLTSWTKIHCGLKSKIVGICTAPYSDNKNVHIPGRWMNVQAKACEPFDESIVRGISVFSDILWRNLFPVGSGFINPHFYNCAKLLKFFGFFLAIQHDWNLFWEIYFANLWTSSSYKFTFIHHRHFNCSEESMHICAQMFVSESPNFSPGPILLIRKMRLCSKH